MPGARLGARGSRSLWLVVALCCAFAALHLTAYLSAEARRDEPLFGDFFAFWSFARFLSDAPPAAIYDIARLTAYQQALDPRFHGFYPFPYPPVFALLLRPLASLGYLPAYAAWIGAGLAAYLAAASRGGPAAVALAALAPATTTALIAGQNGFLTAALLAGGLPCCRPGRCWRGRCSARWPTSRICCRWCRSRCWPHGNGARSRRWRHRRRRWRG